MKVTPFFSKIKTEIISRLIAAESEVIVSVAWLIDEDLIRTMSNCAIRNVKCKVLISNHSLNFQNPKKFESFLSCAGELHVYDKKFLHHKFCVIDKTTLIVGSYNWTYRAESNLENILVIELERGENDDFIKRFLSIHNALCTPQNIVLDQGTLKGFGGKSDTQEETLELEEINLRNEFEQDVKASFEEALKFVDLKSIYQRMADDGGGVHFVKRLIREEFPPNPMKPGFEKLASHKPNLIHLSFEFLVTETKYRKLFEKEELEFCDAVVKKYRQ